MVDRKHGYSRFGVVFLLVVLLVLSLGACSGEGDNGLTTSGTSAPTPPATTQAANNTVSANGQEGGVNQTGGSTQQTGDGGPVTYTPDVTFTLRTEIAEGRLAFVGVGGAIDGAVNPTLNVPTGEVLQVTLINGDGAEHDISFPEFSAASDHVVGLGASSSTVFRADQPGEFAYFCTLPGHRLAGMEGKIAIGGQAAEAAATAASIAGNPMDIPSPVGDRDPQVVKVALEAVEMEGQLADGTTYTYWTFNRQVPGPFLRVRVGDTVELTLRNQADSRMIHSIDLHAVTGPGGGAEVMQVPPGQKKTFTFKALNPGLYVYHCATPMVPHHISNGMYGLILVEPEGGLPEVDQEFYIMQGEIYTQSEFGQRGKQEFSVEKMLAEQPEYFVLNGSVGSLTQEHPLRANVGETVRVFFGVGGPNFTSSFHVIGEILDRVYDQASLTAPPLTDVQTTTVPPGGATMVEFKVEVPGRYIMVDHALSRLERGLVCFLYVEGEDNTEAFREGPAE